MIDWFHPSILFIFGAFLIPFLRGKALKSFLILIPAAAFIDVASMSQGTYWTYNFAGNEIIFGKVDKLSLVFAYVFTIMAFIGMLYALHVDDIGQHIAAFLYVGSSLGVVFAGDYFVLFVFWEIMAFASVYLVFARREKEAVEAGFRYILVHIFGGVCLLGGIILHYISSGSILFGPIEHDGSLAFYLILLGFILNAAVPPLNAWLTDAYPEATVTGAVFMCAYTTKTAVYVLVRAFPGTEVLVWLGVFMALYGVVYAVLENDCRRLLAYHIVSQVGYMVAGVGIGTELSLNGSTSHAFAHILYKALLFMGAGAVIYMTGKRKLTELGGLYKTMPITLVLYMIGGFAISAFPLFSGFVSKSMVVAAASHDHRAYATLLLTLASSGTFLHTGLKLPYYMFFAKDSGIRAKEPPLNMLIGMGIAAFLCIAIGVFPNALYAYLPYPVHFEPYTPDHVTSALGILMFTALAFFLFLKYLDPEPTISVDTDWFYRKGARVFMWFANKPVAAYESVVSDFSNTMILKPLYAVAAIGLWIDKNIIDWLVNAVASFIMFCGSKVRQVQTGFIQHYAMSIVFGVVVIVVVYSMLWRS
ncbi:MAG: Na(+)/H(+) antiporter subunit D [Deltaproteobacteria bacterium]|nr:Na(+)/H(+) antiporter subunit D [Deltaproteobacteria bacterium]